MQRAVDTKTNDPDSAEAKARAFLVSEASCIRCGYIAPLVGYPWVYNTPKRRFCCITCRSYNERCAHS